MIGAMVMSRLLELMIPMLLGRTTLLQTKTTTVRDVCLSRYSLPKSSISHSATKRWCQDVTKPGS